VAQPAAIIVTDIVRCDFVEEIMKKIDPKPGPKQLNSDDDRRVARNVRDSQWEFMERCKAHHPLWWCVWNKERRPELEDEWRSGLLDGMEILDWIESHRTWFRVGKWSDARYARPIRLKPAGLDALEHKEMYDMEPVRGGLVEPGYETIPLPSA
jgi:hypothetical protein